MNVRKGSLRALIVVGLPWLAYWGWTYMDATKAERAAHAEAERLLANAKAPHGLTSGQATLYSYEEAERNGAFYWSGLEDKHHGRVEAAISIGLGVPLALAVASVLIAFIVRGFRAT